MVIRKKNLSSIKTLIFIAIHFFFVGGGGGTAKIALMLKGLIYSIYTDIKIYTDIDILFTQYIHRYWHYTCMIFSYAVYYNYIYMAVQVFH